MKKGILIVISLIGTIIINISYAQILHPVKWSYASVNTGSNDVTLLLKATIEPGWHIYSTTQAPGGPVKTTFSFKPSKEYTTIGKLIEPKPVTKFEDTFSINVSYFDNEVTFQQKVKISKPGVMIKGSVNFMVCNDKQCLPPETVSFSVPVR